MTAIYSVQRNIHEGHTISREFKCPTDSSELTTLWATVNTPCESSGKFTTPNPGSAAGASARSFAACRTELDERRKLGVITSPVINFPSHLCRRPLPTDTAADGRSLSVRCEAIGADPMNKLAPAPFIRRARAREHQQPPDRPGS